MSQSNPPNPPNQSTNPPNQPSRGSGRTLAMAGLAIVAILSLAFAGYTAANPHGMTITQQQFLTNTQSIYNTQTQVLTSVSTVTSVQTVTHTTTSGYGYGYYQNCPYYGCSYPPPVYNYNPAYNNYYNYQSPCAAGNYYNNNVTCQGFFYQASNGCTVLVIPVWNPVYQESYVYQYYTLHNLPTTYSNWTWVTVSGQIYRGSNTSPTGVGCPGNYINVSSITT